MTVPRVGDTDLAPRQIFESSGMEENQKWPRDCWCLWMAPS